MWYGSHILYSYYCFFIFVVIAKILHLRKFQLPNYLSLFMRYSQLIDRQTDRRTHRQADRRMDGQRSLCNKISKTKHSLLKGPIWYKTKNESIYILVRNPTKNKKPIGSGSRCWINTIQAHLNICKSPLNIIIIIKNKITDLTLFLVHSRINHHIFLFTL